MKKCGINILLALSIFYTAFGQNRGEEVVVENRVVREVFLTPLEDSDVIFDLPPRTSLPSKLDLGPLEVHSTG